MIVPASLLPKSPRLTLDQLRAATARLECGPPALRGAAVPFGVAELDQALPQGGLTRAALRRVAGAGLDREHGVVSARFIAGIPACLVGPVLCVVDQPSALARPFAPGLASAGLHPDRVIYAEARHDATLLVTEEGLRHRGLAGVVAELAAPVSLVASRRLQLAAEATCVMAILLHRQHRTGGPDISGVTAAATRWHIAALSSGPALPHAPDVPGVAPALWRLDIMCCRVGRTGSWIMEACDASGRLGLAVSMGHGSAATGQALQVA